MWNLKQAFSVFLVCVHKARQGIDMYEKFLLQKLLVLLLRNLCVKMNFKMSFILLWQVKIFWFNKIILNI